MKPTLTFLILAFSALGLSTPAAGQNHTIRVEDGKVYVDGRVQPPDAVPASLELEGLSASLSFSGDTRFRLGDETYRVDGGRLIEVEAGPGDVVIFLGREDRLPKAGGYHALREMPGFRFRSLEPSEDPTVFTARVAGSEEAPLVHFYRVLDGQLEELNRVSRLRDEGSVLRLKQKAVETANTVKAFPQVELQSYLLELQDRNEPLYDGILKEHLLELESRKLASRILTTDNTRRQSALEEELRSQLDEIFELKQSNRRAEIDQLSVRLQELRAQMDAREQNRQEIIDRRLRELLGRRN